MELYYKGRIRKLKEAVLVANKILKSEEFYNKISEKQFFDNTFPADLKAEDLAFFTKKSYSKDRSKNIYRKCKCKNSQT